MSLLTRIQKATLCAVDECDDLRAPDAEVCEEDLTRLWRNQLDRQPDGTYRRRRTFRARDESGLVIAA